MKKNDPAETLVGPALPDNGSPRKTPRGLDPTLQLAAKVDRLFDGAPIESIAWVLSFIATKYRLTGETIGVQSRHVAVKTDPTPKPDPRD